MLMPNGGIGSVSARADVVLDRAYPGAPHPLVPGDRRGWVGGKVQALAGYDVTVIAARDRDEALNAAAGVDLGLMLCAASLPKGSGYELARTVRERWPAAAVLLLTSGFEVFHKARAAEAGVSGHLTKPLGAAAMQCTAMHA